MINEKDFINHKFNKLTILKFITKVNRHSTILCKCDCGKEKEMLFQNVVRGMSKSCGCLKGGKVIHGLTKTRFRKIYTGILQRCNNINRPNYNLYGGRGIKVLWDCFEEFKGDMHESYLKHIKSFGEKNTTIDRIDNNGNYSKDNCRWATRIEQARNTRQNRILQYNSKEYSMAELNELFGMPKNYIYKRLYAGKNIKEIINHYDKTKRKKLLR